jgi:hypothetical protein
LHLRGEVRDVFFDWLRENRPDLISRYQELYRRGAYMPTSERERLSKLVKGPEVASAARVRGRLRQPQTNAKPREEADQKTLF